jgi:Tol biopolymer transport system component
MITDDEVMRLLEGANPVPRRDHRATADRSAIDVASCVAALRARTTTERLVDVDRTLSEPAHRRPWLLASAASLAVIVAGALVLVAQDGEPDVAADPATVSVPESRPAGPYFLDVDTGERSPLANSVEGAGDYQPSPDGTRLLFYSQDGVLSIANADGSGVIALDYAADPKWDFARWSPDGTHIVYQERSVLGNEVGNLFVHELATGVRRQITHLEQTVAPWITDIGLEDEVWWWLAPSFSPDGQTVVFHLARSAGPEPGFDVWSVPVTGGEPELLIEDAASPMYLPDGDELVYVSASAGPSGDELRIADADGSTRLLAAAAGIEGPTVSPDGARVAYSDAETDGVNLVDVETGEVSTLEDNGGYEWVDDHTLLIS